MKLKVEGVSEIVLQVKSMERALNFWSEKLGFPIVDQWGYSDGQFNTDAKNIWSTWLYVGGNTRLGLWLPRNFSEKKQEIKNKPISQWEGLYDEGGIHVHFALYIKPSNFKQAVQTLKDLNIDFKLIESQQNGQLIHRLYFKDTENNVVELYTLNMREDYLERLRIGLVKK
jgi:catechol 2,3-dioxygenase-like lactoylglutathione lyase family enzyme